MERIALIIPPSVFLADERVFPSLGILKIAACLEKADYPVSVLDLSGIANYEDAMIDFCCVTDANIFGLSCTSPQMPSVEKLVKLIREMRPGMRIILGGAHITATCSEYRDNQKTGMPSRLNFSASNFTCGALPEPSIPSSTINFPFFRDIESV